MSVPADPAGSMRAWETVARETVLDRSPWLVVENHSVRLPNGEVIPDWAWVVTPDFVIVAAVTEDDRFLSFRQTKYAIAGETLAAVGGYIEPGEEPLAAAKRELREETGYESPDWIELGTYAVDANRGVGSGHFFLARDARFVGNAEADDLEDQELFLLTRAQIEQSLRRGEFKVMAWAAALALALLRIDLDDASAG
jgi:ADP-ribose pyrophosphatase